MRKISYWPYWFLALFFLTVMNLPKKSSEQIRSLTVCTLSPCWQGLHVFREKIGSLTQSSSQTPLELERLSMENQLLHAQMQSVREWLLDEERIQKQVLRYQELTQKSHSDGATGSFFKRRSKELLHALDLQTYSLTAKVIYREPASWSSALWINVGEQDNEKLGKQIIGKNSPVLLGTSIAGVVEHVGKNRSRVRLITDASLVLSVRAVRGDEQNRYLLEHLDPLTFAFDLREDLFSSKEEWKASMELLHRLKKNLEKPSGDFYLAKGELRGTSNPLWRSRNPLLKGIGFNCDFPDAEGPAREFHGQSVPLLSKGDLLITTGLDGLFPPGFRVATISCIHPLREGASSYEIRAVATAGDLDELTYVFVLPPLYPR